MSNEFTGRPTAPQKSLVAIKYAVINSLERSLIELKFGKCWKELSSCEISLLKLFLSVAIFSPPDRYYKSMIYYTESLLPD